MPPKRKAAAGRKRPAAAAADSPAARRQKKAEPVVSEEMTEVNVYVFDARWQQKLHGLYTERKLTDVVLAVGDRSVAAHRVILATVSPHLQALFGNDMVESQARVVELQQLDWDALKAIVDFAYTGSIALSGATVVSIIQAANLLQVEAVERAAVDFLVERLDAGNVLSAMALGEHLSAGAIGRELRDKGIQWVAQHFDEMAAEPAFLALSGAEIAALVAPDSVESEEEAIFAAVLAWVKEDEVARKAELGRLLPLVRFPLMKEPATAMQAEPLVTGHALAYQLLFETLPEFVKFPQAAGCPRLVPRKGTKPSRDLSWMCTTDAFQGFRKLTHFPTVALAVSRSNVVVVGKAYDAPAGWHWATAAEVAAVPGWERKPGTYNYRDQGGWQGYTWEGLERSSFTFREGYRAIRVGMCEGMTAQISGHFAGIVCMPD
jgi:hypothetical protein